MKKTKFLVLIACFLAVLSCVGCGSKKLDSAQIVRDDARTGGSLSFVYDKDKRIVFVGGENEVVQYSNADESKGLDAGCRIGLKVTAPDENLDLANATLEMNGVNYASGKFLETINGQTQRFFNIYPIVSKKNSSVKFSVVWQDGTEKQEYKIVVIKGTMFMDKDGNVK